ncbi:uncharacterized protein [Haliotis cracherodii]|uniref:uncharacterized protein n=1 Tax=Haliotis cracherodii TaxID=6455 RepID=UPI0039E7A09F
MPHTLNEAVIRQSHKWFPSQDECVKDAKRKFEDEFNITKRVIIKKSCWALSADEVAMAEKMKLVENLLTLCYCIQVTKIIKRLSRELCFGCMFDAEGERDHTCNMSEQQLVEKYFNMTSSDVDDGEVHESCRKLLLEDPSFPDYKLKDFHDEPLEGSFYASELQKVDKTADVLWQVEKILKRKKVKGKTYALVRWLGWPSSFDSYVEESELKDL